MLLVLLVLRRRRRARVIGRSSQWGMALRRGEAAAAAADTNADANADAAAFRGDTRRTARGACAVKSLLLFAIVLSVVSRAKRQGGGW